MISPFFAIWLYVLHRLAGPKIRWRAGLSWAAAVSLIVIGMVFFHWQDPRKWNVAGPKEGARYFEPSLAKTASGNFIPAETLMIDDICRAPAGALQISQTSIAQEAMPIIPLKNPFIIPLQKVKMRSCNSSIDN